MAARRLSRRSVVAGGAALLAAGRAASAQTAPDWSKASHGLSTFGDLNYGPDFRHFAYVNPNAPKGGTIGLQISSVSGNQSFNTFNTFNIFILKGERAAGVGSTFDSLMTGNGGRARFDVRACCRPGAEDGGKPEWRFRLRREARFHDGSPLTAEDVAFSIGVLKTKGHPIYQLDPARGHGRGGGSTDV